MEMTGVTHYVVRWINSGDVAYRGRSLAKAATSLVEGTCYGKGPTPLPARQHADAEVSKFREISVT